MVFSVTSETEPATETSRRMRPGDRTRQHILDVALDLFSERGFEGASIRDLAEALGMTKSALYYHFANKDAIVLAIVGERMGELGDLREWVAAQTRTPDLMRRTALRWVDSTTPGRVQGLRFAHANRPVMARLASEQRGRSFRDWFEEIVALALPPGATTTDRLVGLMALDTVSSAIFAARGGPATLDEILTAARAATIALTDPDRPALPRADYVWTTPDKSDIGEGREHVGHTAQTGSEEAADSQAAI